MGGFLVGSLETLRKGRGVTQAVLATASEMTQAEISRLEGRETLEGVRIETLRRYVEGLGGKLALVATFRTGHRMAIGGAPQRPTR